MDYGYGDPVMDKKWGGRPSLQDYLKLAAVQYELDREEAENEAAPSGGKYDFLRQGTSLRIVEKAW